ncbi:hypothetical protein EI77_04741 [Prosthecobacter fusiformis]|uniref:Uncharacterized protein n=1 Tax=Prosthecobacter fusiformis TaxID=48464 RepID=A0A4R7RHS7_9BACT|nr:hypothetical protein [Prosthecobacter fusiformis]TDU62103.1 hypothetical protein EI77_04741 [Prosthecobacter fusiformis]
MKNHCSVTTPALDRLAETAGDQTGKVLGRMKHGDVPNQKQVTPAEGDVPAEAPAPAPQAEIPTDEGRPLDSSEATQPVQDQAPPSREEVHDEAAEQGLVPPIREEDGKFIVTDHEGTEAVFTSREEAVETAFDLMTPEQREKVRAMVEGKDRSRLVGGATSMTSTGQPQPGTTSTLNPTLAADPASTAPGKSASGIQPLLAKPSLHPAGPATSQQVQSVVKELHRSVPGLVHERTHVFATETDFLASDYARQHSFSAQVLEDIKGRDGFFDTTTGSAIIIAENVKGRPSETIEQGLRRTVLEHRVGYDGLSIVLGHSSGLAGMLDLHTPAYKKWQELSKQIPEADRDALATEPEYAHLKGDTDALNLVWFAREAARDPAFTSKAQRPFLQEMWEVFCDRVALLFEKTGLRKPQMRQMRDPAFLTDVREFIQLARDSVVVNRRGQTPRAVATSSQSGQSGRPLAPSLLPDDMMPEDTASRITSIWKPHRPAPQKYLMPDVIDKHLEQFKDGVVKVMRADIYDTFGPKHLDEKSYILPLSKLRDILQYANGDRRKLEEALGYDPGYFDGSQVGIVVIPSVDGISLRMPDGNETGANSNWLPGGKLPRTPAFEGMPEAVIDLKGYDKKNWPLIDLKLP